MRYDDPVLSDPTIALQLYTGNSARPLPMNTATTGAGQKKYHECIEMIFSVRDFFLTPDNFFYLKIFPGFFRIFLQDRSEIVNCPEKEKISRIFSG